MKTKTAFDYLLESNSYITNSAKRTAIAFISGYNFSLTLSADTVVAIDYEAHYCPTARIVCEFFRQTLCGISRHEIQSLTVDVIFQKLAGLNPSHEKKVAQVLTRFKNQL